MRFSILIISICSIIYSSNTIADFSFKKLYHTIIPHKIHHEIIYEEYSPKNITTLTVKNKYGNVTVKTDADHTNIFLKAIKKSPEPEMLSKLTFAKQTNVQEMTIESTFDPEKIEGGIDFELIVPKKVALNVITNEGDTTIKEPYAPVYTATQKGSTTIINAHNTIDINNTNKGNITLYKPLGNARAETNNGAITIHDAQNSVIAHTNYGSIEMFAKDVPSTSSIKLATVSGNILLHLPQEVNAELQASTKLGTITSDHFITLKPQTTQLNKNAWKRFQKQIDGTLGSGEAQIRLSSVKSNIKVLEIKA